MKDVEMTTQASSMHAATTRPRAHSHTFSRASPVLKERRTSFTCKATQTDCDAQGSAGIKWLLKVSGTLNLNRE